jgi:hypothetical protein
MRQPRHENFALEMFFCFTFVFNLLSLGTVRPTGHLDHLKALIPRYEKPRVSDQHDDFQFVFVLVAIASRHWHTTGQRTCVPRDRPVSANTQKLFITLPDQSLVQALDRVISLASRNSKLGKSFQIIEIRAETFRASSEPEVSERKRSSWVPALALDASTPV